MKILLTCASGMSTSLLVNKMKESAAQQGIDDEIWAVGQAELDGEIEKADVLLIGPQLKFAKAKIDPIAEANNVPCDVIPVTLYGRVDGKGVLDFAHNLAN